MSEHKFTEHKFTEREIEAGNYDIELYFKKDERQFRLSVKRHNGCNYIRVEEQNDDECLFHACRGMNGDEFIKLEKPLNNVLIEMYEMTNNIMNSL